MQQFCTGRGPILNHHHRRRYFRGQVESFCRAAPHGMCVMLAARGVERCSLRLLHFRLRMGRGGSKTRGVWRFKPCA